jgi:hypothetical protein
LRFTGEFCCTCFLFQVGSLFACIVRL